jgi:3-methyladenine DNA glycosylase AlkD
MRLAEMFLDTRHDLMQKAVGWMLREVGKRNERTLTDFLDRHCLQMPRTMLRYAIEKFTPDQRAHYMRRSHPRQCCHRCDEFGLPDDTAVGKTECFR